MNNRDRVSKLPVFSASAQIEALTGGLSNESYKVTADGEQYVVRFGRDYAFHHVMRDRELMTARAAHAGGFAPEVVYAESGIMVSRFIDGKTYGEEDVRNNIASIAALVREFHQSMPGHVTGPGFMFWAFHVIRDYARTLQEGGSRMLDEVPRYLDIAAKLEAVQTPLPIVFGHHDLLPANFLEDDSRLWLIDFEYAGFGTAMFDLAGISSNARLNNEQSTELLGHYFGKRPSNDLLQSHAAMQCASLLREAMWSMVSELHLDAPGVDYVAYTEENLLQLESVLDDYQVMYGGLQS